MAKLIFKVECKNVNYGKSIFNIKYIVELSFIKNINKEWKIFKLKQLEEEKVFKNSLYKESVADTEISYPEMVLIPDGHYEMGCKENYLCKTNEQPVHDVKIKGFEIGKYEITFEQWDDCVKNGGCNKYAPRDSWGRKKQPVINVSWNDAMSYTIWLSNITGESYRLPSEAEWEYVARLNSDLPFSTGKCINTSQANFNGNYAFSAKCKPDKFYNNKALEVGSFTVNTNGIYDLHGNVWEWTSDCYHKDYNNSPVNGNSWNIDCEYDDETKEKLFVLRGGSWINKPDNLRSRHRYRNIASKRNFDIGFRVAKSLE